MKRSKAWSWLYFLLPVSMMIYRYNSHCFLTACCKDTVFSLSAPPRPVFGSPSASERHGSVPAARAGHTPRACILPGATPSWAAAEGHRALRGVLGMVRVVQMHPVLNARIRVTRLDPGSQWPNHPQYDTRGLQDYHLNQDWRGSRPRFPRGAPLLSTITSDPNSKNPRAEKLGRFRLGGFHPLKVKIDSDRKSRFLGSHFVNRAYGCSASRCTGSTSAASPCLRREAPLISTPRRSLGDLAKRLHRVTLRVKKVFL